MIVIFIGILAGIILWLTFQAGRQHGYLEGRKAGLNEGRKIGQEEGKQLGLKDGIKKHMITTLMEAPPISGIGQDIQEQARNELINELGKDKKKSTIPSSSASLLPILWQEFGGWLLIIGFTLFLAFLLQ